MNRTIPFACVALLTLSFAGLAGCNKEQSAGPTTTAPAPNSGKGKQFVATLKAMSPDKRQAYAAQHQDEVQNLSRTGDPALLTQFQSLMRPGAK